MVTLRSDQRAKFAEMLGALRTDPDVAAGNEEGTRKINDGFIRYQQLYGTKESLPVLSAYGPMLQNSKDKANALKLIQLSAFDVERQNAAQGPQYANTGPTLRNINPNADPNASSDIGLGLSPGTEIVTDANGRQFVRNVQTNAVTPVGQPTAPTRPGKPSPQASPQASPSAPTFVQPVAGQKDLEGHVNEVRASDADYGTNQHINDELLRLSSNTSTGPGSAVWHTGVLGKVTGTFGGNAAADYQKAVGAPLFIYGSAGVRIIFPF